MLISKRFHAGMEMIIRLYCYSEFYEAICQHEVKRWSCDVLHQLGLMFNNYLCLFAFSLYRLRNKSVLMFCRFFEAFPYYLIFHNYFDMTLKSYTFIFRFLHVCVPNLLPGLPCCGKWVLILWQHDKFSASRQYSIVSRVDVELTATSHT